MPNNTPVALQAVLHRLMEVARASLMAEMASGIAHELNQPLGAIATFSQAGERLLNRPQPMVDRALDVFRQISGEALTAGDGIRRIRGLFVQSEPERLPCHLDEIIDELFPAFEFLAQSEDVQLRFDPAVPLPLVSIDRLRIQHVLFVLVKNAVEAAAEGAAPRWIEISMRADRYAVEVCVKDSGAGLPVEFREHMFRPFFTTKRQGAGLGLASSRSIIESHEGAIGADDLAPSGSRFWFRLPLAEKGSNDVGS